MHQATQLHNYVLHRLITTATYLPLSGQSQLQWWQRCVERYELLAFCLFRRDMQVLQISVAPLIAVYRKYLIIANTVGGGFYIFLGFKGDRQ